MAKSLPLSQLSSGRIDELAALVGAEHVSVSAPERIAHARDMWPRSVMDSAFGRFPMLPDAVVFPGSAEEVAKVLAWAAQKDIPIIAFGAGSGVCAGTLPRKAGVVLSLRRMDRLIEIDPHSLVAEVEPGIYGETLERRLLPLGYTMGHFPSSIYCSTLGGYLAARSAGQMSTRYGKIEDMVVGLEVAFPDGSLRRTPRVRVGTGRMDWNQLIIGSEGTVGVITRAWMRVHPKPEHRCFQGWHFANVKQGLDAMRRIMQTGLEPAVVRLYDEFDTMVAATHGDHKDEIEDQVKAVPVLWRKLLGDGVGQLKKQALSQILRRPIWMNRLIDNIPGSCLLVVLTEGEAENAEHEHQCIARICEETHGRSDGEAPARYWLEHRYDVSYKQSKIFDAGCWVDTMEVAGCWRDLNELYQGVKQAVAPHAFVMAHFSHAYPDGGCIYFSFVSKGGDPETMTASHEKVWSNALRAVHRLGGTITHHHGVGFSKGSMLPVEFGALWPLWHRAKTALDPKAIMNPGKLGESL